MGDKLVLDLETKQSFDDVGGFSHADKLEVSTCGVYSYDKDEYRAFKEEEFKEMGEWLRKDPSYGGTHGLHAPAEPYAGQHNKYYDQWYHEKRRY